VSGFYHQTLRQSPEALGYLAQRGLEDRVAIATFQLGYANRTLAYQLPPKALKAGAAIRGRLQQLGVLRASGHEHFTGSLVVPIHDPAGQVVGLYGRKIRDDLREGTPIHLYLPGPHRGVWNEPALRASNEIILCAALLDALTFWVAGFRHVTASYGVRGFTEAHRAAFRAHGIARVLLAYDRDDAGETAAATVAEELLAQGIGCYRVQFPRGMDANAYALSARPAAESLGALIRHAVWLGSGPPPSPSGEWAARAVDGPDSPRLASIPEPPPSESTDEVPIAAVSVSPEAPPAPAAIVLEATAHEHRATVGDRHYRIRGLATNRGPETLRVTLIGRRGEGLVADTLDLYAASARARFAQQAATTLGIRLDVAAEDLGSSSWRSKASGISCSPPRRSHPPTSRAGRHRRR
jgi:hypothetical protein